jgi:putative phosphoserine phosphatase/1-acylglycerol-3-phosphate O-acyltransferase
VIAPEGTRVDTTEVGPFKKGAFRMAMTAGIPIVPIVIRNAELVAARNSTTINPGTVDVAVFPPISVQDWTLETLPDRIAEVRQLYLDTLVNWPVDELPEVDLYAEKKAAGKARSQSSKANARKAAAKKTPAKAASKPRAKKAAAKPPSPSASSQNGEVSPPSVAAPANTESPESPPRGRP